MNPNGQNGNNNSFNPLENTPNGDTGQNFNAQGNNINFQSNTPQFEAVQNNQAAQMSTQNAIPNQNYPQQNPIQNQGYASQNPVQTINAQQSVNTAPSFSAPQNPYTQQAQMSPNMTNFGQGQITNTSLPQMPPLTAQGQVAQAQSKQPAPKKKNAVLEIVLIVFIFILAAAAVGGSAYCWNEYSKLSADVNSRTSIQVSEAKENQKKIDDQAYENRNASTTREFTGPSDFGAITFKYPKEWNVYLKNNDDSNPKYEAYFSPNYVAPVDNNHIQPLSFRIVEQSYTNYIKKYENKKLTTTSAYSINGLTGSKVTGKLNERQDEPNGAEVVIQVNNYAAIIRTDDYDTYGAEFDAIIAELSSAKY